MVEAVRRYRRILQTGSHERSNPVTRFACELVRNGRIGQVKKITTFVGYHNKVGPGPGWKPMPVPEGFDYQTWLGPAPLAPYHKDRCLYRFRFNYDYSGGQVTNFGAHSNDMAQWAMATDGSGPRGSRVPRCQVPARREPLQRRHGNPFPLPLCQRGGAGLRDREVVGRRPLRGQRGHGAGGLRRMFHPARVAEDLEDRRGRDPLYASNDHVRNFLDCVSSRREPAAPVEVGHRSASLCHLGNIAIRLWKQGKKKVLRWDPGQERFSNDDDANAMLARPMRGPWTL